VSDGNIFYELADLMDERKSIAVEVEQGAYEIKLKLGGEEFATIEMVDGMLRVVYWQEQGMDLEGEVLELTGWDTEKYIVDEPEDDDDLCPADRSDTPCTHSCNGCERGIGGG